jgi:hypothetical protein
MTGAVCVLPGLEISVTIPHEDGGGVHSLGIFRLLRDDHPAVAGGNGVAKAIPDNLLKAIQ